MEDLIAKEKFFFVDKPHSCSTALSAQQSEVVKFFEENPKISDVQIIRVFT